MRAASLRDVYRWFTAFTPGPLGSAEMSGVEVLREMFCDGPVAEDGDTRSLLEERNRDRQPAVTEFDDPRTFVGDVELRESGLE
jgi:hypothetical protein